MSYQKIKITIICKQKVQEEIKTALTNSEVQFNVEEIKEPTEAYCIYIPDAIWCLSVALHILEAKKDVLQGNIELPDGTVYELTDEGMNQLRERLTNVMTRKREIIRRVEWWSPFIPEIKEQIIPELKQTKNNQ